LEAAIYARVSSPKQASIPQQVELCRKRLESLGHRVRFILKEEGVSAKSIDRPRLQQLFQLCQDGKVDVVVVWKLDRLVRSLRDLLNTHNYLKGLGVGLISVTEQFDTTTSFGRFSFRNIASAAELERELIGERTSMGKLALASRGCWTNQIPPYGYDLGPDRKLQINPTEAEIIKRVFRDYAHGVPITEISRQLSTEGHLTRRGRTFSTGALDLILKNPIYRGEWNVMGFTQKRPDLRLITTRTWNQIQGHKPGTRRDSKAAERRRLAADNVVEDYIHYLRSQEEAQDLGVTP
jgi:site-specific DNA recombinase